MDAMVRSWEVLLPGTRVEVRSRFDGSWVHGFEVSTVDAGDGSPPCYRLRRVSDGVELPVLFDRDDVAPVAGPAPVAIHDRPPAVISSGAP